MTEVKQNTSRSLTRWITLSFGLAVCFVLVLFAFLRNQSIETSNATQKLEVRGKPDGLAHFNEQPSAAPAIQQPPVNTRPPISLDESYLADQVIPKLLSLVYDRMKDNPPGKCSRFLREEAIGIREGRLIALAYPDLMEKLALSVAEDTSKAGAQRFYMMFMLGVLAENGRHNAKAGLVRLANSNDSVISARAIYVLYPTDLQGEFREVYLRKSSEGIPEAFWPLSQIAEASTEAFMKQLASRPLDGTTTAFNINAGANEALAKYRILMSSDWQFKLADIVLKEEPYLEVNWAVQSAMKRNLPNLTDLLRQRLDISAEQMKIHYTRLREASSLPGRVQLPFEEMYTKKCSFSGLPHYYDDILVTQLNLGGKLSQLERARLRTFGYACDPKERLAELIPVGDK